MTEFVAWMKEVDNLLFADVGFDTNWIQNPPNFKELFEQGFSPKQIAMECSFMSLYFVKGY